MWSWGGGRGGGWEACGGCWEVRSAGHGWEGGGGRGAGGEKVGTQVMAGGRGGGGVGGALAACARAVGGARASGE
ncbi:vegetative cell wall protein gp1 [Gracilaria domingensis]|nr:vegetative cell wall protein gp1 [Gracilaria domingensis]